MTTALKMWTKKDFEIKGERTGTRIRGNAEYLYYIYWNGKALEEKGRRIGFTTKREANEWLGSFIRWRNTLAKQRNAQAI